MDGNSVLHGGISGCVTSLLVHPFDFLKVQAQLTHVVPGHRTTFRLPQLYRGLSASLLRGFVYSGTRLPIFSLCARDNGSLADLMIAGAIAGAVAGFLSCPADVAFAQIVRHGSMDANVIKVLRFVWLQRGIRGLWAGGIATCSRALLLNASQLSSFTFLKKVFDAHIEGKLFTVTGSAIAAGLIASFVTLPVDLSKTLRQSDTKLQERTLRSLVQIIRDNGVIGLWRGFLPYSVRVTSVSVITLTSFHFLEGGGH